MATDTVFVVRHNPTAFLSPFGHFLAPPDRCR
jgi:hypothetical protein